MRRAKRKVCVVRGLPTCAVGPAAKARTAGGMSTPQISVLLPTVRPTLVRNCVASISAAAEGLSHEVIVVADFPPDPDWAMPLPVRWIVCPRRGPVDAVNMGYRVALGEYLFLCNDESSLEPGALSRLW